MVETKIEIKFNGNPDAGLGFSYNIYIGLEKLVYNNGSDSMIINYGVSAVIPNQVLIGVNTSNTIDNTLLFLNSYWGHPSITYSRVGDSIFATLLTDAALTVTFLGNDTDIELSVTSSSTETPVFLKYFFGYTNIVNDTYKCEIYTKIPTDNATEIQGRATLERGSVKDHLDPIRGTGLAIDLEATTDLTLEDLYTEDEQNFSVKFYKNNKLIFLGFLKPDGVFQSFVSDIWIISLDCVDGLGALENLSFVQDTGFRFTGKMKAIDIIYNCLKRTGVLLPINTSINTLYEGLTPSVNLDVLDKMYLNSDRYFKTDGQSTGDGTIMSCDEVLKSVLKLFFACIVQENGEWYIFKPNELYQNSYPVFRRYNIDGVFVNNVTVNLNRTLGSQIDNAYPHHCNGNQTITIKGSASAFRMNYKYGFVSGLLPNSELLHDGDLNYEDWNVEDGFNLINDPSTNKGFTIRNSTFGNTTNIVKSDPLIINIEDRLVLSISFKVTNSSGDLAGKFIRMRIQQGIYYLKYAPGNDLTPIDDTINAEWTTNSLDTYQFFMRGEGAYNLVLPDFLSSGNLTLAIMTTYPTGGISVIKTLDLKANTGSKPEIGEFHTVSRKQRVSSIIKDNETIFNGDNAGVIYIGAVFKEDQITPTDLWFRTGFVESKPILQIGAEDSLRISQKPTKIFKGDFYGYIPYLSLVSINNIEGKFMPIEWSYDTYSNTGSQRLLQLFAGEVPDIQYAKTFDYGNVVTPTITS